MKRVEFSELPKLHAICNRWMHFFRSHFWSPFGGFGAPAKKRPQRRARITSVHFFLAKNRKVLLRFGTISRTWHNFSKDQLLWTNRPRIRAIFLPQTQRYAEIWRAFFTLHVLNRFGMFAFWWTDLPSKKCPLPNRNTVGREPKNVKKKALFRRMAHASHRMLCKEKRP